MMVKPLTDHCPICGNSVSKRVSVERAETVGVCSNCGTWFRDPCPTAEDLKSIYSEEYYDAWDLPNNPENAKSSKQQTFLHVLTKIESVLQSENRSKQLLDIGAATGHFMGLAKAKGWSVYGLETNPYSLDILRSTFGQDHVFADSISNVVLPDGTLDLITMFDAIEHIPDTNDLLSESNRLLKVDGLLCITTPRIDSLTRVLMKKRWPHYKEEHIYYFSKSSIHRILNQYGFTVEWFSGHTKWLHLSYLHAQFQRFPHWLFTPFFNCLNRVLPAKMKNTSLPYRCGEMLVIARKVSSEPKDLKI